MSKKYSNFSDFFEDLVQEVSNDTKVVSVTQYNEHEDDADLSLEQETQSEVVFNVHPCVDLGYVRHLLVGRSDKQELPFKSFVVEETDFGKRLIVMDRLA